MGNTERKQKRSQAESSPSEKARAGGLSGRESLCAEQGGGFASAGRRKEKAEGPGRERGGLDRPGRGCELYL